MSQARQSFMEGLSALQVSVDSPLVLASDPTGDFLRRGITVAAYNLLETFIVARTEELAMRINAGHTQFLDLPDAIQRRAISNTLSVASARLRWDKLDLPSLRAFASDVGTSLSAVATNLRLSSFTWLWSGSNMGPENLRELLTGFHVSSPMATMRDIAGRLNFNILDQNGALLDFKEDLRGFLTERNRCAHEASYGVTSIWIRTTPNWVLKFGVVFDVLASVGACLLRAGDPGYLSNADFVSPSSVALRFVRHRAKDFGEYLEHRPRAVAVDRNLSALYAAAAGRCGLCEVLVEQDAASQIVRWSVPAID